MHRPIGLGYIGLGLSASIGVTFGGYGLVAYIPFFSVRRPCNVY